MVSALLPRESVAVLFEGVGGKEGVLSGGVVSARVPMSSN